jgi:hypothetical protein
MIMHSKLHVLACASAVLCCSGYSQTAETKSDAKALEIAKTMMKAMGGQDAWNSAHFVRYDFKVTAGGKQVVDRSHLWDKQTGRYRLEQKNKAGERQVALFNTGTKQGTVFVKDRAIEGVEADNALKDAYGTHINDMYWLSMPWKWMDQGVHLKYEGTQQRGNTTFDVVKLTFDHVGLTPGDQYKAYVSPASHLMTHWEYTLQGGNKGSWDWEYADTGGVKLAKNHTSEDGKSINMGNVRVLSSVDDAYFTDPSRTLQTLK